MKYIALYINCIHGKFEPYGPFESEATAWGWINKQNEPEAYSVFRIQRPS